MSRGPFDLVAVLRCTMPPAALQGKIVSAISKSRSPAQRVATSEQAPAKRPIFPVWAWIAAAALALMTGYSIRRMTNQTAQLATLRRQMSLAAQRNRALQDQLQLGRQVAAIMMSPDSIPLKLMPKAAKMPVVRAYLHPRMGMAVTADQMPAVPAERTLQLWVVPMRGQPLSVAIFRPDLQGQVAIVAPVNVAMNEMTALAISEEPAGGSPHPTAAFIWVAQLQ